MEPPAELTERALGSPLARRWYARPVLEVARGLLGRVLVRETAEGVSAGRILEVEAYRGADDPASHAYRGLTRRTEVMFGPPGFAYVYFTYGMHFCFNVVVEPAGRAAAVLIRALEPVAGAALMSRRRGPDVPWSRLARGPACVAVALALGRGENGLDLTRGPLWVSNLAPRRGGRRIVAGSRIGIRVGVERPWRFLLEGHPLVSGSPKGPRPAGKGGRLTPPGRIPSIRRSLHALR